MIRLILLLLLIGSGTVNAQQVVAKSVTRKGVTPATTVTVPQPGYTLEQLKGKWQEVKRTELTSSKKLPFTDTLQLDFNKRDSVTMRNKTALSLEGAASIDEGNNLQAAGDAFTIISLSKNILVLDDGEFRRELHKKKRFYHETLGNIILPKENLSEPVTVNRKHVIGKWDIYRTQAVPGAAADSAIIKSLELGELNEDGSLSGQVTFIKNQNSYTLPIRATIEKGAFGIYTTQHEWKLQTYKADGKEFVFGHHGGLVYFAKHL